MESRSFCFVKSSCEIAGNILEFVIKYQYNLLKHENGETTWKKYGNDYIDSHWDKLVFSLRSSKGMGNYPNIKKPTKKASMEKWTVYHSGGYKGALHVRVKNN